MSAHPEPSAFDLTHGDVLLIAGRKPFGEQAVIEYLSNAVGYDTAKKWILDAEKQQKEMND